MTKDSLGDRMKNDYENTYRIKLTRRTPVIIRLDMKCGHTFTKGFKKPYDMVFKQAMWNTAKYLCGNIQNARLGYVQSDEISILMIDYNKLTTSAWFDNNIQKICSVSASMATMAFNNFFADEAVKYFEKMDAQSSLYTNRALSAMFDSRCFNIPESDVCNYFIWRQQDATRNSIETLGRCYFSNKELHKVNCKQIQDKLVLEKEVNWNNFPTFFKRGICVVRVDNNWEIDTEIPVFTQDRHYVERCLLVDEI